MGFEEFLAQRLAFHSHGEHYGSHSFGNYGFIDG